MEFLAGGGRFRARYRCYPMSFLDKPHLEGGDKVVLPPSALDRLGASPAPPRPPPLPPCALGSRAAPAPLSFQGSALLLLRRAGR